MCGCSSLWQPASMTSALYCPLPPALRRSAALFTMLKPMWLPKPSLNPNGSMAITKTRFSLFSGELAAPSSRLSFRLVPHAHASGSGRTVWDEAADSYFGAKGGDAQATAPTHRTGIARSAAAETRSNGRATMPREEGGVNRERERERGDGGGSQGRREEGYGDARSAERSSYGERSPPPPRARRTGSQSATRDVQFAGREWGSSVKGSHNSEGGMGRDGRDGRATSAWSRSAAAPQQHPSKSWSSDKVAPRGGGPNGYRNDRRGGYGSSERRGGGSRREKGEDEEFEGEEEAGDAEDGPRREAMNWRLEGEPLYGVAPICAAFMAGRREFHALYVQENVAENVASGKRKDKQAVNWVLNRAHNLEVKVKTVSKHDLNLLVDNRPHQGLVLDASPLELVPRECLDRASGGGGPDGRAPVWVALDEVIDPQNFGAILRSCHYLGAAGVVVCAKNSAPLSGVVSKASAGALEVMEVQSCRNMMKFLDASVQNGWRALGASSEPRALPVQELLPGLPTILVLGNEGRGLRTNVKRSCTELVSIIGAANSQLRAQQSPSEIGAGADADDNMPGSETQAPSGAVDSLNVSVAAGILLHDLLSRSIQPRVHAIESQ